jgi:hypothetical protein
LQEHLDHPLAFRVREKHEQEDLIADDLGLR